MVETLARTPPLGSDATGASARSLRPRRLTLSGQPNSPFSSEPAADRRAFDIVLFALALACWMTTRHYLGVWFDARIYVGRALADLAPGTIGRDLMFAHDGQAPFSLFTLVMRALVAELGAPAASAAVAFAATALWFAAFAALAHKIASGRSAWAMVMFVAVLPATYGGFAIIPYGEALAVPRPFAEAAVLAALCAVLNERRILALGLLVVAALFHPIMALCGFGVLFLMLGWRDARWFAVVGVGAAAVLVAAALGAPLADRLFQRVDPQWLGLLHGRNPYLFPALWSGPSWGRAGVQLATAAIAAALLDGAVRRLFVCAIAVAVAGVALTFVAGDLYPSLLVLQVQPWRALWLVAVLAAAGAALCGTRLWTRGPAGQVTLALLAAAWMSLDMTIAVAPALLAAAVQIADARSGGLKISRFGVRWIWIGAAAFIASHQMVELAALAAAWRSWPADLPRVDLSLRAFDLQSLVIVPLTVWVALSKVAVRSRTSLTVLAVAAFGLLSFTLVRWPQTTPSAVRPGGPDPTLVAMLRGRPGPIEWLDSDIQPWTLAGRSNWASEVQGGSIVFGRAAGIEWRSRMQRLVALGLVGEHVLTPWDGSIDPAPLNPSATSLSSLCATPDGPAWIVAPLMKGKAPPLASVGVWRAPYTTHAPYGRTLAWTPVRDYAVIPCGRATPDA